MQEPAAEVGRYVPLRVLGQGATSQVLLAEDPAMKRLVAIKVLNTTPGLTEDRFAREVQLLADLSHPNIVQVFDVGRDAQGRPFLVMEFGGSSTLASAELSLEETAQVLADAARACSHAHERGIVHRDLKPANILVGDRHLVADFGIAKLADESHGLTETGSVVGTPAYMAPEQALTGKVEPGTDVYALGAILYEQLCGRLPHEDIDTLPALLESLQRHHVRSPAEFAPDAPPALVQLSMRALAQDPAQRPSAEAFGQALTDWLRSPAPACDSASNSSPVFVGAAIVGVTLLGVSVLVLARPWATPDSTPERASSSSVPSPTADPTRSAPATPRPTPTQTPTPVAPNARAHATKAWEAHFVARMIGEVEPNREETLRLLGLDPALRALVLSDLTAAQRAVAQLAGGPRRRLLLGQLALCRSEAIPAREALLGLPRSDASVALTLALLELREGRRRPSSRVALRLMGEAKRALEQDPSGPGCQVYSAACRWLVDVTHRQTRPGAPPLRRVLTAAVALLRERSRRSKDWRLSAAFGDALLASWARGERDPKTFAAARAWLERARDRQTDVVGPRLSLALWHLADGSGVEARRELEAAKTILPRNPETRVLLRRAERRGD